MTSPHVDPVSGLVTPWPQMGVFVGSVPAGSSSSVPGVGVLADGGVSAAFVDGSDGVHQAPSAGAAGGELSAQDSPYVLPASSSSQVPSSVVPQRRRRGLGLVITGLVTSFIVAPVVLMGWVLVGSDVWQLSASMRPVAVHDEVVIDDGGAFFVMALGAGSADGCVLEGSSGAVQRLEALPSAQPAWWADGITPGTYRLSCEVAGEATFMATTKVDPPTILRQTNYALVASSVVGLAGAVVTIAGVRRLAKR